MNSSKNKPKENETKLWKFKEKEDRWFDTEVIAKLTLIFLIIECVGIITAAALIYQNISEPPFSENINDPITRQDFLSQC